MLIRLVTWSNKSEKYDQALTKYVNFQFAGNIYISITDMYVYVNTPHRCEDIIIKTVRPSGFNTVSFGNSSTFRGNLLQPDSGSKNKPSQKTSRNISFSTDYVGFFRGLIFDRENGGDKFPETSVSFRTARRYNPEDNNGNLKSIFIKSNGTFPK
jgi:hypothetical protein